MRLDPPDLAQILSHANTPDQCKPSPACVQAKARARRKAWPTRVRAKAGPARKGRGQTRPTRIKAKGKPRPARLQAKTRPARNHANASQGQTSARPSRTSASQRQPAQHCDGSTKKTTTLKPSSASSSWTHLHPVQILNHAPSQGQARQEQCASKPGSDQTSETLRRVGKKNKHHP